VDVHRRRAADLGGGPHAIRSVPPLVHEVVLQRLLGADAQRILLLADADVRRDAGALLAQSLATAANIRLQAKVDGVSRIMPHSLCRGVTGGCASSRRNTHAFQPCFSSIFWAHCEGPDDADSFVRVDRCRRLPPVTTSILVPAGIAVESRRDDRAAPNGGQGLPVVGLPLKKTKLV